MGKLIDLYNLKGPEYYNTDKGTLHNYLMDYDLLFAPFQNKEINFLEVGYYLGGSCRLWEDYFSKAQIRYIDIDPLLPFQSKRAIIDYMDINNLSVDYFKNFPIDIAIEDSCHYIESQLHFIRLAYPALRPGGLLIIEDTYTWETHEKNFKRLGFPFEVIDRRIEQNRPDEVLLIFKK